MAFGLTNSDAVGTLTLNGACPFAGTVSVEVDVVQEPAPGTAPAHASPTVPANPSVELTAR